MLTKSKIYAINKEVDLKGLKLIAPSPYVFHKYWQYSFASFVSFMLYCTFR